MAESPREYLYAIQNENGRELVALKVKLTKVSEITAQIRDGKAELLYKGKEVVATVEDIPEGPLTLYRWPADDKFSEPVAKPVKHVDA